MLTRLKTSNNKQFMLHQVESSDFKRINAFKERVVSKTVAVHLGIDQIKQSSIYGYD
jgi:hypothetical protein